MKKIYKKPKSKTPFADRAGNAVQNAFTKSGAWYGKHAGQTTKYAIKGATAVAKGIARTSPLGAAGKLAKKATTRKPKKLMKPGKRLLKRPLKRK